MKRFLSIALAAIILVAMAIPVAFAADNDATQSTAPAIDTTKDLTVTIHKFDPKGVVTKTTEDGETEVDVPGSVDAKAGVKDATFTAFKVLEYDAATKSYKFTNDFKDAGLTLSDVIKVTTDSYSSYGTTAKLEEQIAIMQNVAGTLGGNAFGVTDENGEATINVGKNPGVYLVMETVVPSGYIVTTQAFLVSLPTYDGKNDAWNYNVDALPKNTEIDVDKSVDGATVGDSTDARAVGDIVKYTITLDVPNYGRSTSYPDYQVTDAIALFDNDPEGFGIKRFNSLDLVFTDTLSKGLTFLPNSLDVKVGTKSLNEGEQLKVIESKISETATAVKQVTYKFTANDKAGDYTLGTATDSNDSTVVTVDVAWAVLNDYQGQTITLTYKAQVNEKAVAGTAENNTVKVSFVNDPTSKKKNADDPNKPDPSDPEDPPRDEDKDDDNNIYTYAMDLTKKFDNQAGTETEWNKVVFTLSKGSTPVLFLHNTRTNTYTAWLTKDGENNTYTEGDVTYAVRATYADKNGSYPTTYTDEQKEAIKADKLILTANVKPLANGVLKVEGLSDGTYTLTETKTANGYTILTAPITIVVSEVEDDNDNTKLSAKVDATIGEGNTGAVTCNNPTDGHFAFTVNNPKAKFFSLPTTGGLGLWLFTVCSGVLMAGAIIFITFLRKRRA